MLLALAFVQGLQAQLLPEERRVIEEHSAYLDSEYRTRLGKPGKFPFSILPRDVVLFEGNWAFEGLFAQYDTANGITLPQLVLGVNGAISTVVLDGGIRLPREFEIIGRLKHLETVGINMDSIDNTPDGYKVMEAIGQMPTLKHLLIAGGFDWNIQTAEGLARSQTLETIVLRGSSSMQDYFHIFRKLPRLKRIVCTDCYIRDDSMQKLSEISTLEELDLRENRTITDKGYAHLAKLKRLRKLQLDGSERISLVLRQLPELEEFRAAGGLPAWASVDLKTMPKLRVFDAGGAFTAQSVQDFCTMENLEVLGFSGWIKAEDLKCIPEKLKKLRFIAPGTGHFITNETVTLMGRLPHLEVFMAPGNRITEGGLAPLKGKKLREIYVHNGQLTGKDLAFVTANFPDLEQLHFTTFLYGPGFEEKMKTLYTREQLLTVKKLKKLKWITLPMGILSPDEEKELKAFFFPGTLVWFR